MDRPSGLWTGSLSERVERATTALGLVFRFQNAVRLYLGRQIAVGRTDDI